MLMASITDLVERQRSSFGPDLVAEMSVAFDSACAEMKLGLDDVTAREVVANRILGLAFQGEHTAEAILQKIGRRLDQPVAKSGSKERISTKPR